MNRELNLKKLWKVFTDAWWKILIVTLAAMLIVGAITVFLIPKKYSSSVTFYVINSNTSADYTTTALLAATEQLANDYTGIITSDLFLVPMSKALAEQNINLSTVRLRSMIGASVPESTSRLVLQVTSTNPEHAFAVAEYITNNAPAVVKEVSKKTNFEKTLVGQYVEALNQIKINDASEPFRGTLDSMIESMKNNSTVSECLTVLNYPSKDAAADSPSLMMNLALTACAAVLLTYLFFLIKSMMSATIVSKEDLTELTDFPVIGVIPHWSSKEN